MRSFGFGVLGLAMLAAACGSSSSGASSGAPADGGASKDAAPVDPNQSPPMKASTEIARVQAIAGIDLTKSLSQNVGAIGNDPAKLKALMEVFERSLGVKCTYCHTAKRPDGMPDYEASSAQKKITSKMWDELVVGLQFKNGDPLFCDSCHQGKAKFLDRERELSGWMSEQFIDRLARKQGPHSCSTCHGSPFDGAFLDNSWSK